MSKEQATNDSYQAIASNLHMLKKTDNIDKLVKIGGDIESLPAVQKTNLAAWKEQRRSKLTLWLMAIDKIDEMTDPNWDENDVPQFNVAPPSVAIDAGVAPEEIKDPEVRSQYEQAIKVNAEKAERYRSQRKLREMDRQWSLRVRSYIEGQYTSDAQDVSEVDDLIDKWLSRSLRRDQMKEVHPGKR
jgi:hypothetical protein